MRDKSIKRPSISCWSSSNLFKTQAVYSMIGLQFCGYSVRKTVRKLELSFL